MKSLVFDSDATVGASLRNHLVRGFLSAVADSRFGVVIVFVVTYLIRPFSLVDRELPVIQATPTRLRRSLHSKGAYPFPLQKI